MTAQIDQIRIDGQTRRHRIPLGDGGFDITVRRQSIRAQHGYFVLGRFGEQEVPAVVETAVRRKVKKLVKERADRRILMLERSDWQLDECQILRELRTHQSAGLADVNEVWVVETTYMGIVGQSEEYIDFKLYDERFQIARSFSFLDGVLFDESTDGVPKLAPRAAEILAAAQRRSIQV